MAIFDSLLPTVKFVFLRRSLLCLLTFNNYLVSDVQLCALVQTNVEFLG